MAQQVNDQSKKPDKLSVDPRTRMKSQMWWSTIYSQFSYGERGGTDGKTARKSVGQLDYSM